MRFTRLSPIFAGLIAAACAANPPVAPPPPVVKAPSSIGPGQGVDLVTDVSLGLDELKANRVDFVARYYRPPESRWPALSPGEAQLLSARRLKIVAVWEWHSRYPSHFTYSSGYDDATMAYRQAKAVGQPAGSAIYFAVDFDARSLASVGEYFQGVAAGFAAAGGGKSDYTIGVYGSGAVCSAIKQTRLAQYSWLSNSFAWAGSVGYADWNIRQGERSLPLSFNHDFDEAKDDYGGFVLPANGEIASAGADRRDHHPAQTLQQRQALTSLR